MLYLLIGNLLSFLFQEKKTVDYYSLMWFDHLDYQDVEKMREQMHSLYSDGKPLEGAKQADLTVERTHKILYNKGIFTQLIIK